MRCVLNTTPNYLISDRHFLSSSISYIFIHVCLFICLLAKLPKTYQRISVKFCGRNGSMSLDLVVNCGSECSNVISVILTMHMTQDCRG